MMVGGLSAAGEQAWESETLKPGSLLAGARGTRIGAFCPRLGGCSI